MSVSLGRSPQDSARDGGEPRAETESRRRRITHLRLEVNNESWPVAQTPLPASCPSPDTLGQPGGPGACAAATHTGPRAGRDLVSQRPLSRPVRGSLGHGELVGEGPLGLAVSCRDSRGLTATLRSLSPPPPPRDQNDVMKAAGEPQPVVLDTASQCLSLPRAGQRAPGEDPTLPTATGQRPQQPECPPPSVAASTLGIHQRLYVGVQGPIEKRGQAKRATVPAGIT